jgi:membrane-associated phospholipid phosphatase
MIVGQHHWLSDVVAGALFGQAIGWSIGHDFARARTRRDAVSWQIVPMPGATGLAITGTF